MVIPEPTNSALVAFGFFRLIISRRKFSKH
jgi:hypothetical protein